MTTPKLSRRTFLAASAAAGLLPALPYAAAAPHAEPWPENGTLIPDEGWTLWIDEHAQWKDDAILLPEQITRDAARTVLADGKPLPVNAPTGGWERLTAACPTSGTSDVGSGACIPVTLPGTVEQHLWGNFGQRPYTPEEYRYAADDPIPQNGAYFGVSWWHRAIDIPAAMRGKRIFLHIRGAHLRAEVYLNRRLVGYSIMEELPFECDLTHAADPGGLNLLAIRITNPFGRFDWVDGLNAQWGAVKIYRSHGFGGLDRGLTIRASSDTATIEDFWVLNTPDPRTVEVTAKVILGFGAGHMTEDLIHSVIAGAKLEVTEIDGKVIGAKVSKPKFEGLIDFEFLLKWTVVCADAKLWDIGQPNLYGMRYSQTDHAGEIDDARSIAFGFRWFTTENVGTNGIFRLNGRRLKIYTSISWGFWGINGMWPTPDLAEKEVTQAQKLNLNCLNFHRNLAKEDVLRAHDRLGLLRYMEPGAGKMAIGRLPTGAQANSAGTVMEKPTSAADKFAQRYMFVKCVEMVKAFRSHPSVIEYCLQNEIGADLKNPDTIAVLEAMRAEDPSRCIVLNDGFVAPPRKAAQAWFEPYNDKLHRSDEEEWGGWWNQHQGAGDQWYDEFYKSPTDFTYKSPEHKPISEFGEMEGCATPDNHSLMLHQHADPAGSASGNREMAIGHQPANKSYDHTDHAEILAAYDAWLDRWGFRKAFPATESLWLSLGKKCYDTWQNYLENARISDDLDFCAISGWESTAIENHSGIVDNLRNFKSDPTPIAATLLPVRPIAKQRSMCTALGQSATFDLFLLNDTSKPVTGTLNFTAVTPSGKLLKLGSFAVPAQTPDVFSYLIQESLTTPALTEEGMYRFKFSLSSAPQSTQTKEVWVTNTKLPLAFHITAEPGHRDMGSGGLTIALSGVTEQFRSQVAALPDVEVVDFDQKVNAKKRYDLIISSGLTGSTSDKQESGDTTGLEAQPSAAPRPGAMTPVPGRKLEPGESADPALNKIGHLQQGIIEAVKAGTPLLAIPQADALSEGVAKQLAAAGAFTYNGTVGDFRAPWMGNWYFVREHALFAGLPQNQCMGIHYQAKGRQSNGLLVGSIPGGPNVEIVVGYSRDHDRNIGAGTFTTRLGTTKILFHRVPELHPVLQQRFLANAIAWLTSRS